MSKGVSMVLSGESACVPEESPMVVDNWFVY